MVASFVAGSLQANSAASTTTVAVNAPPDIELGDLIVVTAGNSANSNGNTIQYNDGANKPSGGFTFIKAVGNASIAAQAAAFWKIATQDDVDGVISSYSLSTIHSQAEVVIKAFLIRGVDQDDPIAIIGDTVTQLSGSRSFAITGPSNPADGNLGLAIFSRDRADGTGWGWTGGDWTDIHIGLYAGTFGTVHGAAYAEDQPAGAMTTATVSHAGGSADLWCGFQVVLASAPEPPAAPANPAAAATGTDSIEVTWDDVADETGYRVERSDDGSTGWVDVSGALAADEVSFEDTGLSAETEYFYRVFAVNDGGDSEPSDVVSATTDPPDPTGAANRIGGAGAVRRSPNVTIA